MTRYRIEIAEWLPDEWSEWFDDWLLHVDEQNHTVLMGRIRDQSELHGALSIVRDLRLTLISIQAVDDKHA